MDNTWLHRLFAIHAKWAKIKEIIPYTFDLEIKDKIPFIHFQFRHITKISEDSFPISGHVYSNLIWPMDARCITTSTLDLLMLFVRVTTIKRN